MDKRIVLRARHPGEGDAWVNMYRANVERKRIELGRILGVESLDALL